MADGGFVDGHLRGVDVANGWIESQSRYFEC